MSNTREFDPEPTRKATENLNDKRAHAFNTFMCGCVMPVTEYTVPDPIRGCHGVEYTGQVRLPDILCKVHRGIGRDPLIGLHSYSRLNDDNKVVCWKAQT